MNFRVNFGTDLLSSNASNGSDQRVIGGGL